MPGGNSVTNTLDNAGNMTAEGARSYWVVQRSISRSFEALSRVQQVTGASN